MRGLSFGIELELCFLIRVVVVSGFACKGISCAMKSYRLSELTPAEVQNLKARPRIDFSSIFSTVRLCLFVDCFLRT